MVNKLFLHASMKRVCKQADIICVKGLSSGGMITVFSAIVYIVCVIIYHAKNMIIKFIQAKRDVTQMA